MTPAARRTAVTHAREAHGISERRACSIIDADRSAIRHALARADGNISHTAKLLGVSRPTLYDLLKSYDLHA